MQCYCIWVLCMRRIIIGFLASIGFLCMMMGAILCVGLYLLLRGSPLPWTMPTVPPTAVLEIKLGASPIPEHKRPLSFDASPTLIETLNAIKRAASDKRIQAIFLNMKGSQLKFAHAQELRTALENFKAKNKKVYAYTHSFGHFQNGTALYYLACVAHKVYMQPYGSLNAAGFLIETLFLKDFLDKFDIDAQFTRREAYKGVIEPYTQNTFSPEVQKNMRVYLNDILDQVVEEGAVNRGFNPQVFRRLLNNSPYDDHDALRLGLIDGITHQHDVKQQIRLEIQARENSPTTHPASLETLKEPTPENPPFISVRNYIAATHSPPTEKKIALIYVSDIIGGPTDTRLDSDQSPENLEEACARAIKNPEIQAVVIRIDSPGGEVSAAETIWAAIQRIKASKKPVVVSMGTIATSAGYLIATPADKIIASPGTLTGSIGVAFGKFSVNQALNRLGLNFAQIQVGENAGVWSQTRPFQEKDWEHIEKSMDHIYTGFLRKVADGRNMSIEQVKDIAQGQVWSGIQAYKIGLVDDIGGIEKAISCAKQLAHIPDHEDTTVVVYNTDHIFFWNNPLYFMGLNALQELGSFLPMIQKVAVWMDSLAQHQQASPQAQFHGNTL